ncbi:hypothetical protein [Aeoliella mucimassa]|uniref:PEP-CTERM protein-sorting domain-containing protein n=1 Tax=Aeoliella mucimassa TaxID=2527972 RepID=A0A518ANG3_9BACT|nr:hypothetical protein [Aeoliella mucimassa]QDU56272.1 hypothetical protein Pan181_24810 [Aeoliella mucimassa]
MVTSALMRAISAAIGVLLIVVATPALASLQMGSKVHFNANLPGTHGGRFLITDGGSPAGKSFSPFETFCVEITEHVSNGAIYYVAGISDTTVNGGNTITNYMAWLYTEFRNGSLSGFDYSGSGTAARNSANALQYALWREIGHDDTTIRNALGISSSSLASTYTNPYNSLGPGWLTDYNADPSWDKSSGYLGQVRVMNLTNKYGTQQYQDQLVLVVPEPMTVFVWTGLIVAGMVIYSKRKTRVQMA